MDNDIPEINELAQLPTPTTPTLILLIIILSFDFNWYI